MKKFELKKSVDFNLYDLPYASVRASNKTSYFSCKPFVYDSVVNSVINLTPSVIWTLINVDFE